MRSIKGISHNVINRLPKYLQCLYERQEKSIQRITSAQIAAYLDTTPSQVRQDFSVFGSFGATGYGYEVSNLIDKIERIMGLYKPHNIAVIGVGGIGKAMLEHMEFERYHYHVTAAFDINPELIGHPSMG